MRCEDAFEMITELVDGELDAAAAAALRKHLDVCASCRAVYEAHSRVAERVRSLPRAKAPEGFARRVSALVAEDAEARSPAARDAVRRRPIAVPAWATGLVAMAACAVIAVTIGLRVAGDRRDEETHYHGRLPALESRPDAGPGGPEGLPRAAAAPRPAEPEESEKATAFGAAERGGESEGESEDALGALVKEDPKELPKGDAPVSTGAPPAPSRARGKLADGARPGEFGAAAAKKMEKSQDSVLTDSTEKDKEYEKPSDEARKSVAAEPLAAKGVAAPSADRPRSIAPTGTAGGGGGIGGPRGAAEAGRAEFAAKKDADAAREPRLVWRARDAQTAEAEISRLARELGGSVIWSASVGGEPILRATVPADRAEEFEAMLALGRRALDRQGAADADRTLALKQVRESGVELEDAAQAPEPPAAAPGAAAEEAKVAAVSSERGEALREANASEGLVAAEQARRAQAAEAGEMKTAGVRAPAAMTAQAAPSAPEAGGAGQAQTGAAAPAEAKQKKAEPQPQRVYVTFSIEVELGR